MQVIGVAMLMPQLESLVCGSFIIMICQVEDPFPVGHPFELLDVGSCSVHGDPAEKYVLVYKTVKSSKDLRTR